MKVVIIGAGIAGLSIGWRLAQAGAETLVLERAQPGRGATWASAGMLAAVAESGETPGAETEFAKKSLALWHPFAAEIEAASGQSVTYRRDGALLVALDDAEAASLRARAAAAGVGFLSPEETRTRAPMLRRDILGALWAPEEAQVDNRFVARALTSAYLGAGGRLSANEAAVRIEPRPGGRVAALTPFALHEADAIVIAAGAWSSTIAGFEAVGAPAVRPVKGEMIALIPPADEALPLPLVWGNGVYLVPRRHRLLVGATVSDAGYDTSVTSAGREWLFERASGLMPSLAKWMIDEHWAGLRPGSPDGMPLIGETALEKVFVASGQYRNGILFAPLIAETVKLLVLEQRAAPEIAHFDPRRFQK
jgi:glycine oxidase